MILYIFMKPFIVIGNGKSLQGFDFTSLDGYDCIGLNGSFRGFDAVGWHPNHHMFINQPRSKYWTEQDVQTYIWKNEKIIKQVFIRNGEYKNVKHKAITRLYTPSNPPVYDVEKFAEPLYIDAFVALQYLINDEMDQKEAEDKIFKVLDEREDYNPNGIYKMVHGMPLDDTDFITLPRYDPDIEPPKSFSDFNYVGGNTGFMACLVGYLLGYKKIILIGFDFNFEFRDNKVLIEKTFWNPDHFKEEFDVHKDYCPHCKPEDVIETLLDGFQKLQKMIQTHSLDLDIVNCTLDSRLDLFRKSDIAKEL